MTQLSWQILLLKIGLIASAASVIIFTVYYTAVAPWWRNQIGRTIVIEGLLLLQPITLSILSLFFGFNRLTSNVAVWITIATFYEIAAMMLWRTRVWHRNRGNGTPPPAEGG